MKLVKLSLVLISTLLSAHAFADTTSAAADDSGTYLEFQAGWVLPHDNLTPSQGNPFYLVNPSTVLSIGPKLSLGYQFNQNLALQVGYFLADYNTTSGGIEPNYKSVLSYYDVAVKAMYPITQNFNVYGLLGLAYAVQQVSGATLPLDGPNATDTGLLPEIGGGLAYYLTSNLDVSLSTLVIAGNSNIQPTIYFPLGISYRF